MGEERLINEGVDKGCSATTRGAYMSAYSLRMVRDSEVLIVHRAVLELEVRAQ
jgi:hypothetical protein